MPSSAPSPKPSRPGKSLLRFQAIVGLMAAAIILAFIAYRFQVKTYITTKPLRKSQEVYDRMWFNSRNILAGARMEGGQLRFHREGGGSTTAAGMRIPVGAIVEADSNWAISPDLNVVTWVTPGTVFVREVGSDAAKEYPLPSGAAPLSVAVLHDATVGVAFADGTVGRWSIESGEALGVTPLGFGRIQHAAAVNDYLAAASAEKVSLYRYRDGLWTLSETVPAPPPPFRAAIPAPGSLATISNGFLRFGGESRNTRGPVRSIVSYQGTPITSGEFENVWTVTSTQQKEEDYEVAQAAPNSVLALGASRLAVSDANGTAISVLTTEERLTSTGRIAQVLAFLSALCSLLLAILPMLLKQMLKLFARLLGGKQGGGGGLPPATLGRPPVALIERIAAGRSLLWAGAGLSAQAGLSTRKDFIVSLINAGTVEGWLPKTEVEPLQTLVEDGEAETAMFRLAEIAPKKVGPECIRSMIPKYAAISRCHEILQTVPFAAGLTTNYDMLLERMKSRWNTLVLTPGMEEVARAGGIPFLMKLYGDVNSPASVRVSRAHLAADFPGPAKRLLNNAGSMNTILFVGASVEGLLADLDALGLAELRGGVHFAVAGSANPQWKKIADELKGRYSIEVIACLEETIPEELPKFLEILAREVAEIVKARTEAKELTGSAV